MNKRYILAVLIGLSFLGCNENSSTNSVSSTPASESRPIEESTVVISGKVIDAEIVDATVFLDLNRDEIFNNNEPHTKTKEDGSFELLLSQADIAHENYKNQTAPLIAYGGKDIRTQEVFEDYLKSMIDGKKEVNITPFTTLIASSLDENLSVNSSKQFANKTTSEIASELKVKIAEIKKNIAELFGISEELLDKDPLALAKQGNKTLLNKSLQLHKSAQLIKKAMKSEVRTLKRSILKSYRRLARELKKLKRTAVQTQDEELIVVLDEVMSDRELFDTNLVSRIKDETRSTIRNINAFWRNHNESSLSDERLTGLINGVETVIKENRNNGVPNLVSINNGSIKDINQTLAIRFLNKATFGATKESIDALQSKGVEAWLNQQLSMPLYDNQYLIKTIEIAKKMNPAENSYSVSEYLADNDIMFNQNVASFHSPRYRMTSWFNVALRSPDQLRAKVTYALSQIIVESDFEPIFIRRAEALATYFDILQRYAFGRYENLLNEISLNSGMGVFLTFNGSKKEYKNNANSAVYPDENYAREIMQLFSLGLEKLKIDGTPIFDANGNPIPTYTQEDVNQLSRVFTGWDLKRNAHFGLLGFKRGDYTHSLEFTSTYHDSGEKKVLGKTIPSGLSGKEDIQRAISIIMSQSSVAPYISKNLIMRLVKSNPSPSYIARVASVFKTTRGDLKAVTKAIFLDKELWKDLKEQKMIKFKESLVAYTSFLRAFNVKPMPKWYYCGYGNPSDATASNCQVVEDAFLFNDTIHTPK